MNDQALIQELKGCSTNHEVSKLLQKRLGSKAIAFEIDGAICDLLDIASYDFSKIKLIAIDDFERAEEVIRHDAAHLLAQAALEVFPGIQVTIGPVIENGFYYDFATSAPIKESDLEVLEKKMRYLAQQGSRFERMTWGRQEAIDYFASMGQHYKVEIIKDIPADQKITVYKQGDFIDLCRGPHGLSVSDIKHFKLTKVAGAYWRGDSKNQMLQRVYGTAWATKERLDAYLNMLKEAAERDHRKLGKDLGLFHVQEESPGMVFWHEQGYKLWLSIESYMREKLKENGYFEVRTPVLLGRKLWESSGHWEKFRENMFTSEVDDDSMALKPMSCPGHIQIFKQGIKSYKELPMRMAEFGLCHRYEASGALHGLLRVRGFVQDDGHIFCTPEQIADETIKFCEMLFLVYKDFGFTDVALKFSDRPALRAGSDEIWDLAESALKTAMQRAGLSYELNPGEGAFYGPKIEFVLKDAIGRSWQLGTLQVDFVLPERLNANYINSEGQKVRPVMLHRAILGTFERFIGILLEHHKGHLPLWLAPTQICVAGVTNEVDDYVKSVNDSLLANKIRSEVDVSSEKIGAKIRRLSLQKVPLIAVVGSKEKESGTLAVRSLGSNATQEMSLEDLINFVNKANFDKK